MQNQEITEAIVVEETTTQITLPSEVLVLANEVDEIKRKNVTTSLNKVFESTQSLLKEIEEVVISDPTQIDLMKQAKEIRLKAKNQRLDAEKLFDAKRSEVQQQMAKQKTEDALYLKAKQTMQIQYKHIEEIAEFKEKFAERYEAEQIELRYQMRLAKLEKFNVDLQFINLKTMDDVAFQGFYEQQEILLNAKLEAERLRQENERLEAERVKAEQEKARIEQEKAAELARIEAEKKAEEERIEREKEVKRLAEIEAARQEELKAARQREEEAKQREEAAKIEAEKIKAEAEAQAKQLAEIEAEKQKRREFEEAEMSRLAKLDDVGKLVEFKNQLAAIEYPICKDKKNQATIEAAKDRINKIIQYLDDQLK